MVSKENYNAQVFKKDASEVINTLSPNGNYYYKFQEPEDIYWGLFLCKVAFYSVEDELIYHHPDQFAQCGLNENHFWQCVFYSASGNMVFFAERNSTKSLHWVFIHLPEKGIYRKSFSNNEETQRVTHLFAKNGFADELALEFTANKFEQITDNKLKSDLRNWSWQP